MTSVTTNEVVGDVAGGHMNVWQRLYRGETKYPFLARRRRWYLASAIVILAGLVSLGTRGLNLGIEFQGGTSWEIAAPSVTASQAQSAVQRAGLSGATVQILGGRTVEVQAKVGKANASATTALDQRVAAALGNLAHKNASQVSVNSVGPTWGSQISRRAIEALILFFIAITIYISVRFEWKMAAAALIAVAHDILVTVGIYSLVGFQVTPDTVVAFLTILGYSLYDTIVVFDRVKENARGLSATGRMTYSDMVNLSVNQTLARSINTSLMAIIPILSVLVLGAYVFGATTLQDFGLALFIGLTSGAYSSLFIASPLLAGFKEGERQYASIRQKLEARGQAMMLITPAAAARDLGDVDGQGGGKGRARGRGPATGRGGILVPGGVGGGRRAGAGSGEVAADEGRTGVPGGTPAGKGGTRPARGGRARAAGAAGTGGPRPAPRPRKKRRR